MTRHKDYCPGYDGDLYELAREIVDMTHDSRAKLLGRIACLITEQREQEEKRGRKRYTELLKAEEKCLGPVSSLEDAMWDICKRYTEVEKKSEG